MEPLRPGTGPKPGGQRRHLSHPGCASGRAPSRRTGTMFTQLTDSAKAFVFYGIAVILTVMVTLAVSRLGELTAYFLHMYGPTLATLLMLLVVTRDGRSRAAWRAL